MNAAATPRFVSSSIAVIEAHATGHAIAVDNVSVWRAPGSGYYSADYRESLARPAVELRAVYHMTAPWFSDAGQWSLLSFNPFPTINPFGAVVDAIAY